MDPKLTYYDAIIVAGQCGRLMAKLRKCEIVDFSKLKVLASDLNILPSHLKAVVLPTLDKSGVLNVIKDGTGAINRIEEDIPTLEGIFPIVHEIWSSSEPEDVEAATLESQELCCVSPLPEDILTQNLTKNDYSANTLELAIDLQSSFGILGTTGGGDHRLMYSEYSWGEVMKQGGKWMDQLPSSIHDKVKSITEIIHDQQGFPLDMITAESDILNAARKAGLIRVCRICTSYNQEKDFVFTPSVGTLYHDESDEVKTFLGCLRYGQYYARTSKIKNPLWIVDALIERDTHTIGPSTDIGTDYVLLEKAGIVKVEESKDFSGRYTMTLIKNDTAKLVKEVITHGTVSGLADEEFSSMLPPSSLIPPEQDRIRMGRLSLSAERAEEQLYKTLRRENL